MQRKYTEVGHNRIFAFKKNEVREGQQFILTLLFPQTFSPDYA